MLQRQVMEIERREAELNPEPDDARPSASGASPCLEHAWLEHAWLVGWMSFNKGIWG